MKNQQLTKRERRELRRQEKQLAKTQQHHSGTATKWIKIVAITLVAVASIGGIIGLRSLQPTTTLPTPTSDPFSIKTDDWIKGNKESKVTLVEYLDFECEACGAYFPLVKRLTEEYGDRVAFVSRYFPIPSHRNSMASASAVEAAGKQGKYWEMYNMVFENQSAWGEKKTPEPKIFEEYAQQLGLDMEKFKQDVLSQEVKDRIERDRNAGIKLNIQGTPSFFLNGKKIENPRGYEDFKKILEGALKN